MGYYTVKDFMLSVAVSDVPFIGAPCWIWTGRRDRDGYGWLPSKDNARELAGPLAHRFAYVAMAGRPIFEGQVIDHLCRQRSCVNPLHLRAVRNVENVHADGSQSPSNLNRTKTHCKWGHPFTDENTYITAAGHRVCRTCGRAFQQAYQRRKRGSS